MEKKMTKKEMFAYIAKAMANDPMVVAFCDHELELLTNKVGKSGQTKTQIENESIKAEILTALMNIAKPVTISDLQKSDDIIANYSNQKISALLRQLLDDKKVVKVTDKKKSYFSIAE